MVIGVDVFHKKGMPSVTGFVSSLNSTLTQWFSKVAIQKPNQQMSDSLQINFYSALEHYYAVINKIQNNCKYNRNPLNRQTTRFQTESLSIEMDLEKA